MNVSSNPLLNFPCSGMLAEAVLPPSKEHSYAQWLERTYQPRESRSPWAGKTDPLLPPDTVQSPGVTCSLPIYSAGEETVETCRECHMSTTLLCVFPFLMMSFKHMIISLHMNVLLLQR